MRDVDQPCQCGAPPGATKPRPRTRGRAEEWPRPEMIQARRRTDGAEDLRPRHSAWVPRTGSGPTNSPRPRGVRLIRCSDGEKELRVPEVIVGARRRAGAGLEAPRISEELLREARRPRPRPSRCARSPRRCSIRRPSRARTAPRCRCASSSSVAAGAYTAARSRSVKVKRTRRERGARMGFKEERAERREEARRRLRAAGGTSERHGRARKHVRRPGRPEAQPRADGVPSGSLAAGGTLPLRGHARAAKAG